MNAIGDMNAFQAYQMGNAMPEAAANPAGGLAGAGVGLGMGLAMTNSMGGMMGAPNASSSGPPALPPSQPVISWHVAENGQPVGPFSGPQLAQAASAGRVTRETLVWSVGMPSWLAAWEVEALTGLFAPPPPIPES